VRRGTGSTVATVTIRVTNTGARTGSAVPQLYVGMPRPRAGEVQPPRQLKAFTKVRLAPGASRTVTLRLDRRAFSWWDTAADGWRVARGCYDLQLGRSSRDIVHAAEAGWRASCGAGSTRLR
jgi:beta-glucosidase